MSRRWEGNIYRVGATNHDRNIAFEDGDMARGVGLDDEGISCHDRPRCLT